jgi:hypothetical protein
MAIDTKTAEPTVSVDGSDGGGGGGGGGDGDGDGDEGDGSSSRQPADPDPPQSQSIETVGDQSSSLVDRSTSADADAAPLWSGPNGDTPTLADHGTGQSSSDQASSQPVTPGSQDTPDQSQAVQSDASQDAAPGERTSPPNADSSNSSSQPASADSTQASSQPSPSDSSQSSADKSTSANGAAAAQSALDSSAHLWDAAGAEALAALVAAALPGGQLIGVGLGVLSATTSIAAGIMGEYGNHPEWFNGGGSGTRTSAPSD